MRSPVRKAGLDFLVSGWGQYGGELMPSAKLPAGHQHESLDPALTLMGFLLQLLFTLLRTRFTRMGDGVRPSGRQNPSK
jgi:hypothetical protein